MLDDAILAALSEAAWFVTAEAVSASAASSDSSEEDSLEEVDVDRVSPLFLMPAAGRRETKNALRKFTSITCS